MKYIPKILIISRLILGFIILYLAINPNIYTKSLSITLLITGLLTDIFDGIIARKFNLSTVKLRRLDSSIDQIFFICVVLSSYIISTQFYKANAIYIILLILSEVAIYIASYLKFKKEVPTHSIGAKIWTLILVATLIQIIATSQSNILFTLCIYLGILTRIEILLIIHTLPHWTNDVPTLVHAIAIKKGKKIKRNKWFND